MWFIITMLLSYVLIMASQLLPKRRALLTTNFILRSWSFLWGLLIGLRYRSRGKRPDLDAQPMVVVTNHNSFLDTPVSYVNLRGAFRTLAKRELIRTPVMGSIFQASGIMVDRSSAESRKESFDRMVKALSEGTSLLVYPEGTQNRTRELLQPFFDGAFKAAVAAQVPVQPIVTVNARQLMPQAKFLKLKPGVIVQVFLEPVPTDGLSESDVEELKERVRSLMWDQLAELDPKFPD